MNNRQNGRRRGRGGVRPQGAPRADGGSRIDNRARGNAAQLHEKYRNLARDAQMQGDRVLTEYYFQFADHYFRILAENRPRFEEGERQQRNGRDDNRWDNRDDMAEGVEGNEGFADERFTAPPRERPAPATQPIVAQPVETATEAAPVEQRELNLAEEDAAPRRRRGRPRRTEEGASEQAQPSERIEADRLPPAVRVEASQDADAGEAAPRRRRTRRPRDEGAVAAEA